MSPIKKPHIRLNMRLPADSFGPDLEALNAENLTLAGRWVLADALLARRALDARTPTALSNLADRWGVVLQAERRHLAELLSVEERAALVDLLNGTQLDPWQTGSLYGEACDADPELPIELLSKLRGLSPGAELALVMAIERYWRLPADSRPSPSRLLEYA